MNEARGLSFNKLLLATNVLKQLAFVYPYDIQTNTTQIA